MFLCALDVRLGSLRMVLTSCDPVPEFLEGQCLARDVEPPRILEQLEFWSKYYGVGPEAVVCCREDPIPVLLVEALESSAYPVVWLGGAEVRDLQNIWRALQPEPQWHRGGLMTMLWAIPVRYTNLRKPGRKASWDWLYTCLRKQTFEVEAWLYAEGRSLCPDHLSSTCPECALDREDDRVDGFWDWAPEDGCETSTAESGQ